MENGECLETVIIFVLGETDKLICFTVCKIFLIAQRKKVKTPLDNKNVDILYLQFLTVVI